MYKQEGVRELGSYVLLLFHGKEFYISSIKPNTQPSDGTYFL